MLARIRKSLDQKDKGFTLIDLLSRHGVWGCRGRLLSTL